MPAENPSLGDLLAETIDAASGRVQVAIPATVLAYDPVRQVVTVKPTVSGRYQHPDTDMLIPYPLPAVANVPVAFPSAGGGLFSITWPLVPGDTVLLVICDRSIDEWKATAAAENVPQDIRRHDLTDAVAIPSLRPLGAPIPATGWAAGAVVLQGADVRLGSAAALSPVALAPLVDAMMAALQTWLTAHTHSGVTTGVGVSGPPVVPPPAPSTTAAAKVKAE